MPWGQKKNNNIKQNQYCNKLSEDKNGPHKKKSKKSPGNLAPKYILFIVKIYCVCARLVAQLCSTLQPHGLQPTSSSVHGDSPGKNTGGGCRFLLPGTFPIQGLNPRLESLALASGFFTTASPREPCEDLLPRNGR